MTHRRMFTSKAWTDDRRLLQESNLTARQLRRAAHHIIQTTMSEGLAQGPMWRFRVGFEPATLRIQGAELTTTPLHTSGWPSRYKEQPVY